MPNFPAVPTFYRGVQYRSRLEAKWAAFFDLLGWQFQYEPFDLAGWIPDFVISGGPKPVLVEVKPVIDFQFPQEVIEKIVRAGPPDEVLIVGAMIKMSPYPEGTLQLGWCNDVWDFEPTGKWDDAVFGSWGGHVGYTGHFGAWVNRVGPGSGKYYLQDDWLNPMVLDYWNRAGNLTQWKGKQSITE